MSRPKTMMKIHVNVRPDQDADMHRLAAHMDLTISELYRAALDEFLDRVTIPQMQSPKSAPVSPANAPHSRPKPKGQG